MNAVVSIVGKHAGADVEDIVRGKMADIQRAGMAFWAYRSWRGVKPKDMRKHLKCMKDCLRRIVAIGKLAEPYCVWLR